MNFLYPQFIWALFALIIPVIIHFFNFRRYKTVYFSNTRFLRQVEKKSTYASRLKNFSVLISRLLALAFLVMVFAQPYLPTGSSKVGQSRYASIYVDNSLSMKTTEFKGVLLDEARKKAVEIIEALPNSYQIQVMSNDFSGKQQRYYNKREAINLLDAITPSHSYRSFDKVFERAKDPWEKLDNPLKGQLQLFVISDFQASQFKEVSLNTNDIQSQFIPLYHLNNKSNLTVDSVWFDLPTLQPGFNMEFFASVKNYSNKKVKNIPIQLEIDHQLIAARQIEVAPQQNKILKFNFRFDERKYYWGKLFLDAGQPTFDNSFYFSFGLNDPTPVSVIGKENEIFEKLYNDSLYAFRYVDESAIDYGNVSQNQLVIVHVPQLAPSGLVSTLRKVLSQGHNVVLIPDLDNADVFNQFLASLDIPVFSIKVQSKTKASFLRWDDPIFKGVFTEKPSNPSLPIVNAYLKANIAQGYELLSLENGDPLIIRYPRSNGNIIVFTSSFEKEISNLARHPVTAPILLNAALYTSYNRPLYSQAGSGNLQSFKAISNGDSPLQILNGKEIVIPEQRSKGKEISLFGIPSQIEIGFYPVRQNDELLGYLAINADKRESIWEFLSEKQIRKIYSANNNAILTNTENIRQDIKSMYQGMALWKWFLMASLFFLLIEMILLKFLK